MEYNAPNNQKFLVYNPTNQTLIEKLYYSVSCFILAIANGWEFRINDTEGVKLVEYLGSYYPWWETDWAESNKIGRFNIKNIDKDNTKFITNYTLTDLYPNADVIMVYSNSNILTHILNNKKYKTYLGKTIGVDNIFFNCFEYLFEFEMEYFGNFEYLFDKVSETPHLGVYIQNVNNKSSYRFIKNHIEKGQNIFISGNYDLISNLKKSYNKSYLKTIRKETLDYSKVNLTNEETLTILYEIFLLKNLDSKIFEPEGILYALFKNLHPNKKEIEIGNGVKLIEIY